MKQTIILYEVLLSLQSCSHVLLPDKERKPCRMKVMNPSLPYLVRKAFRKQILDKAKKISVCPHCGELNGTVKKCGLLKIVHEKFRSKKSTDPVIVDALGEFFFICCVLLFCFFSCCRSLVCQSLFLLFHKHYSLHSVHFFPIFIIILLHYYSWYCSWCFILISFL